MGFRYQKLRLILPSLCQFNEKVTKNDWCGRTSSSMIYNYYYLVGQNKTLESAREELVVNPGTREPYNLHFRDTLEKKKAWATSGGYRLAALDVNRRYALLAMLQEAKPGAHWHESSEGEAQPLDPPRERGSEVPSEHEVQQKLAPIIRALEAFNPVLFYSGLTSGEKHIVAISGYEVRRGQLWLHIDDPGQCWVANEKFRIAALLRESLAQNENAPEKIIDEEAADAPVDPKRPGIRYWLRARVLFFPRLNTKGIPDDVWGDHGNPSHVRDGSNRWGLSMYYTFADTPRTDLVHAVPFASYPVRLPGGEVKTDEVIATLWDATARSGAPFPIDAARTWSNGVRIPREGSGAENDEVLTVAPGQIVAARFGAAGPGEPDRGLVIVRHCYDELEQSFVEFPAGELAAHQKLVFSHYARLARPEKIESSDLVALAHPGPEVALERKLEPGDAMTLLAEAADGSGALQVLATEASPGAPPRDAGASRSNYLEEDLIRVGEYWVVPIPEAQRNLAAWEDRPGAPLAPDGAALAYMNPLGPRLQTGETVGTVPAPRLAADFGGDAPRLVELEKGDGGTWYALESYDQPGVDLSLHRWAGHADPSTLRQRAGSGVLVARAATLRFTADGVRGTKTLTIGGDRTPQYLTCKGNDQPALTPGAANGAIAKPDLVAVVPADCRDGDEAKSGSALSYWDPITGAVFGTDATTQAKATLREVQGLPAAWVAITGHAPQVEVPHRDTFTHDAAEVDELLALPFPLVCVAEPAAPRLYLSTDASKKFPDARTTTISGRPRFAGTPEFTSGRMRLWPKLTPAVLLTDAQAAAAQAELEQSFAPEKVAVLQRLQSGESALLGVFVDRGGWVLDGNVARIADGHTDDLRLHRAVRGKGAGRNFSEKTGDLQLITAAPGLALPCVSVFESYKRKRALVEIRLGTTVLGDNAAAVAKWKLADAVRQAVYERCNGDAIVDLAALESEVRASFAGEPGIDAVPPELTAAWRDVAATTIGRMGRTTSDGKIGVHVEVFSEHYLIPKNNAARWPAAKEATGEYPGTQPYFDAQQRAIMVKDRLCAAAQRGKACEQSTRTCPEWEAYCIENHRMLSRIVAFHESQWSIDWNAVAAEADPAHSMRPRVDLMPAAERPPLELRELGLPGLTASSYHYYHPLRLVEWVTTGLEVSVRDYAEATGKALKCQLEIDGEPIELVRPFTDEALFRLRLVVSDPNGAARIKPGQQGVLVLDGLPTAPGKNRIPVLLNRGRVVQCSFTEPGGSLDLNQGPVGYGMPEQMEAPRHGYAGVVHLFADGNEKLADSGVAGASVLAAARYNLAMPTMASVKLGGSGVVLAECVVGGAKASGPQSEMKLEQLEPPPAYPTQARDVDVRLRVLPTRSTSANATLTIAFSGGDLEAPFEAKISIRTREIAAEDVGEDVAKLQLYLSRIRAGNHPCYVELVDETGHSTRRRRTIDGHYGPGTAEALWRFILFFAPSDDWPKALEQVETSTGSVKLDRATLSADALEERVKEQLAAEAYPVVTAELIDQIVFRHQCPWVPPAVEFGAVLRLQDGSGPPGSPKKWDKWSTAARTSMLPLERAQDSVRLPVKLVENTGMNWSSFPVEVVVKESDGYRLAEPVARNFQQLMATGVTLAASGVMTANGAKPVVEVFGYGRELKMLSAELGGTPNLHASTVDGLALAALQNLLTQAGFYTGDIDGESGSKVKTAIRKAAEHYHTDANQYVDLVWKLAPVEEEP